MAPPLTLNEVYAHIHGKEGQRGVTNLIPSIEKLALVSSSIIGDRSKFIGRDRGNRFSNSSDDKDQLKCENFGRSPHTKD